MIIITIIIIINYYQSIKIFISYINRLFLEQYMFFLYLSVLKQIIKNLSVNVNKKQKKISQNERKAQAGGCPPCFYTIRPSVPICLEPSGRLIGLNRQRDSLVSVVSS